MAEKKTAKCAHPGCNYASAPGKTGRSAKAQQHRERSIAAPTARALATDYQLPASAGTPRVRPANQQGRGENPRSTGLGVALCASLLPGVPQLCWPLANPLDDAPWIRRAGNVAFWVDRLGNDALDAREYQAYRGHTASDHGWNRNQRCPRCSDLPHKQETFQHPGFSHDGMEQPSGRSAGRLSGAGMEA
jgi:hypothetical protein